MQIYTKASLIDKLLEIVRQGWIPNGRHGNQGGIGNTLEDLLGLTENNLPIPNAAEWELKTQRLESSSLTTLFHIEPSPQALRFVPNLLLPKYGWAHDKAGIKYPATELSFRQTINGLNRSDRGFKIVVDRADRMIRVSFDALKVAARHVLWLKSVEERIGLEELCPQPYWGFDDLKSKAGTKLLNSFYVQAQVKKIDGKEFFKYEKVMMLQGFDFEEFLLAIEKDKVRVDFDARTGHNHGTKFRLKQNCLPMLYKHITIIA